MVNETSERQPDYAFIEKLLPQTGRAIDCLTNTFGLEHTSSDRGDYVRTNFGQGTDLTASLAGLLDKLGVTVLLNTRVEHILMENGAATRMTVSNESGTFTVTADKVILATGGASHDWDRLVAANPELNVVDFFEEAAVSHERWLCHAGGNRREDGRQPVHQVRISGCLPGFPLYIPQQSDDGGQAGRGY